LLSSNETRVAVHVEELHGRARPAAPVTIGVPLARGVSRDASAARVVAADGARLRSQHRALTYWPDGSVQWLLTHVAVPLSARERTTVLVETSGGVAQASPLRAVVAAEAIEIFTGAARFVVPTAGEGLLRACAGEALPEPRCDFTLRLVAVDGAEDFGVVREAQIEEIGAVRATVVARGEFPQSRLRFVARYAFHAEARDFEIEVTLHNPRAARHVGNVWDLGDASSATFEDVSIVATPAFAASEVRWRTAPSEPWQSSTAERWSLYQDSSGGEQWDSTNHVDAANAPTVAFRGFEVRANGEAIASGERAQPLAVLVATDRWLAATVDGFWQNFPKGLRCAPGRLEVGLFPRECRAPFELQGGEQKRHTVRFEFGAVGDAIELEQWLEPPAVSLEGAHVAASGAVRYAATPLGAAAQPYRDYLASIVEGPRSFFANREIIDEYGWRNFGDLYADHEAVGWTGSRPMVSHYNNQYDFILAAGVNYLRSGDARWRALGFDAARHTIDIDIYHTTEDRPAYNGGLFWHTEHYRDAATCTHRSYSRRNGGGGGYGGGPANEHNYTSGLTLYHCLTGDPEARRAVLGLADWVIAMDDGARTLFAIVTDKPTGFASKTRTADYHKPGRGAGNSINALLDAYLLSGERRYLTKAEELIARCIHPRDDIASLTLDDAENRWSYLVFLQVLGKYLDTKAEYGERDYHFYYARDSVLHYADWVCRNEVPYRDVLHKVEIPTETWPAQDVRKAHVLWLAAKCASGEARTAFAARAAFFAQRCIADVLTFDTAYLTRPRVLIAVYEPALTYLAQDRASEGLYAGAHGYSFPDPEEFVPQRQLVAVAVRAKVSAVCRELSRLVRDRVAQVLARARSGART
jgi:hypothetical protein